jgi:hypothetical protein
MKKCKDWALLEPQIISLKCIARAPYGWVEVQNADGTIEHIPKAPAIRLWKTAGAGSNSKYDVVEVLCPGCGRHHEHGAEEGLRLAHCPECERRFPTYYIVFPEYLPVKYRK